MGGQGQLMHGMTVSGFSAIQDFIAEEIANGAFPGAVTLVARHGRIAHLAAQGSRDAARAEPMREDALFLLASMSKPLTSALAMMLVEDGVLDLAHPIVRWFPELRDLTVACPGDADRDMLLERPIAVLDLLRHTSGFCYSGSSPSPRIRAAYLEANIEGRREDISGDEMLRRLGDIPLAWQPATRFEYSISTDVLGLLLERATGAPLDELMARRLLDPLGMADTVWWVPTSETRRLAEASDADPLKQEALSAYRIVRDGPVQQHLRGGAGLVSTIDDYRRFAQMLLDRGEAGGRRLLSPQAVELMLSDHVAAMSGSPEATSGPGYGFGLGFAVRKPKEGLAETSIGDAMWAGAWGGSFLINPREGLLAICLTQDLTNRMRIRRMFRKLVYKALDSRSVCPPPHMPVRATDTGNPPSP